MKNIITTVVLLFTFITNAQTALNEIFNGTIFPPSGWTLQSVGVNDKTWLNYPHAENTPGPGAVVWEDKTINQNERLITPALNLSSYSSAFLTFTPRMYQADMIANNITDFNVKVSTDNGINWITLWTDAQFNFVGLLDTRQTINFDITNYTGAGMSQVKFMFQYTSIIHTLETGALMQLFDVYVGKCPKPAITTQSTAITWVLPTNFTGTVDIEYGPSGFTQFSGTTISGITANTYTLPNMNCQSYDYFIRTSCGSSSSPWSLRRVRRLVNSPNSSNITATSATIKWTGAATNFTLEYGPTNFISGTGTILTNLTNPEQQLTGLLPCTGYTVRVKGTCDINNLFSFHNFTTIPVNNSPLSPPFTETFDNTTTLCNIGYITSVSSNVIENNSLKTAFNGSIQTRKITLIAGNQYNFSIDVRKNPIASNTNGVLTLLRENDFNFNQNLFTFNNPSTTFNNFNTNFTPTLSGNYYVVFGWGAGTVIGNIMFYDNFSVNNVLSNADINKKGIQIFPNPANNILNFQLPDNTTISKITIIDLLGKKVIEQVSNNNTVNVENLAKGMYVLEVVVGDKKMIEKFVKN